MAKYGRLQLEGSPHEINCENIVLDLVTGASLSGSLDVLLYVGKNTKRGKLPTLLRDGTVSGLRGVRRWWVLIPRRDIRDSKGYKIHPSKVPGVYSRLVRVEERLYQRQLRGYERSSATLNACLHLGLALGHDMNILDVRKDCGERVSYSVGGGKDTTVEFYATELRNVRMMLPTQFRQWSILIAQSQRMRYLVGQDILRVAHMFTDTAAAPPESYESALALTATGSSSATLFTADVAYGGRERMRWSQGNKATPYARLQTVNDPQCSLEWFVCLLPYGYKEPGTV